MKLAKQHLDIGLYTNNKDAMLEFWQTVVGLEFDHLGKLGGGIHQHRHFLGDGPTGPILKINHSRGELPDVGPSGYRRLSIVRDGIDEAKLLVDPDGNEVALIPPTPDHPSGIAIEMGVRDLAAFDRYFSEALEFTPAGEHRWKCGDTVVIGVADPAAKDDVPLLGLGYRYLTMQIFDADGCYQHVLENGGQGGKAPETLGTTVRYGFVRDADGNWIELSQRATLTGAL
ncbi:VOC family protein [Sneathiella sp. P13V-1]|uniref:VOC family protein n=1 Tax=Sneathiella sp. P13V-1 TaxID=2697366 RepID=UPI00187B2BB8|nr:VOC family protein [Sneathiella sp. P13V-1]MBE7637619.1 VOC family protein [Sneathiella sp. P13V-1]